MKWAGLALAMVLAASSVNAAEEASRLPAQAKALIAKPPPGDDIFRLKQSLGPEGFKALRNEINQQIFPRREPGKSTSALCVIDANKIRFVALVQLVAATEDESQWRARRDEIEAALKRRSVLRDQAVKRGEDAFRATGSAHDGWHDELARRVTLDQFFRTTAPSLSPSGDWADSADAQVSAYLNFVSGAEACETDTGNTTWLKAEVARRGWPRISRDGETADRQAFLMVQHADHDPAWQAQVLAQLVELVPLKETNPKNYAYLFDRVAMKHGGPQRFGTQGHCVGVGEWRPWDDEPGDLDVRRTSVGLPSEAEYIAGFKTRCPRADGAVPPAA